MSKAKLLQKKLLGFLPEKLPVGVTEFEQWAKALSETYELPTKDEDSVKFTLASIVMHLGPQVSHKPKYFFYKTMIAAAAKQVAGSVFYNIKEAQKAAALAAKEASNESVQQSGI